MKLPTRQLDIGTMVFHGDPAGSDELLLIPDPVPSGATAIISRGSDYGSDMLVYRITEPQYKAILSDEPPFTYSSAAASWLEENAAPDRGNNHV